jgi:2-amino-4-hydroxy-6-hydroxymethyldihydropteridine diphosphokinase
MNKSYLLIGGNLGDPLGNLAQAREYIGGSAGRVILASSLWQTAAWGLTGQPDFLNQALLIETLLEPIVLMDVLLDIEIRMGRVRQEKYGPRKIDIDVLFYGEMVIDLPRLRVPHPELPNRRFALAPMAEIAPGLVHPVLHRTIRDLLAECADRGDVKKIPPNI